MAICLNMKVLLRISEIYWQIKVHFDVFNILAGASVPFCH